MNEWAWSIGLSKVPVRFNWILYPSVVYSARCASLGSIFSFQWRPRFGAFWAAPSFNSTACIRFGLYTDELHPPFSLV